jgi:hypothetical protein
MITLSYCFYYQGQSEKLVRALFAVARLPELQVSCRDHFTTIEYAIQI